MSSVLYNIFIMPIELFVEFVFSAANMVFDNPGTAIIFVSVAVQLFCFPLYKRADDIQNQERLKQKSMEHWVKHIKKTFSGDERFMMLQTYYREVGYKPIYAIKSSLSLLLQIPFFIAAYHFLSNLEALKGTGFLWISDLSQPDQLVRIGSVCINILPVLMTLFNIISGIIYTRGLPVKDKIQTYGLACLFLVLLYKSPSGLVFYWMLNNLFSLLKNVFLKIVKNPGKVVRIILLIVGIAAPIYFFAGDHSLYLKIFILLFACICIAPSAAAVIKSKVKINQRETFVNIKTVNSVFYISLTALFILLALVIPVSVVKSSPTEFISLNYGPFGLILRVCCVYIGLLFVWLNIFYLFSSAKIRKVFSFAAASLAVIGMINYFFFSKNLGNMSAYFVYDVYPEFQMKQIVINCLVVLILLCIVFLISRKKEELLKYFYQITSVSLTVLVVIGGFSINKTMKAEGFNENKKSTVVASENEKIIKLNKNGKNVIVFMLDRAIGGFLPFIFEEKPDLAAKFDGFTFYPNTISFGGGTNYGTPSLFGGYEYTPVEINKRKNDSLKTKQNEALSVLPELFSENGYRVTVMDPPYAGYRWNSDLSIYEKNPEISAYKTKGAYSKDFKEKYSPMFEASQKRNFVFFSLMKIMPVPLQNIIYDSGNYWSTGSDLYVLSCFIDAYSVLQKLPSITDITNDEKNCFVMMQNSTSHEPILLQTPDYTPGVNVVLPDYNEKISSDGTKLALDNPVRISHYQTNVCALIKVGEWLDYLKREGVYDNTRIVLVSDHGNNLGQFEKMNLDNGIDVEAYNTLLLVKDFNSKGFKTSDVFMTNADTPTLAVDGVISNPVNPFSGKVISNNEKTAHPQIITTSQNFDILQNNGNTFDTSDGEWWSVEKNIFDEKNWKKVEVN